MAEAGQGAAGVGAAAAAAAAQRARGDAMLEMAEKILFPVATAILATEQGRNLLVAEAAAGRLVAFALSMGSFYLLALIRRLDFTDFVSADLIDDCSAFLRAQLFITLLGVFLHGKMPWIVYMPLVFLVLLLVRSLVRIYKPRLLNNENVAGEMHDD